MNKVDFPSINVLCEVMRYRITEVPKCSIPSKDNGTYILVQNITFKHQSYANSLTRTLWLIAILFMLTGSDASDRPVVGSSTLNYVKN